MNRRSFFSALGGAPLLPLQPGPPPTQTYESVAHHCGACGDALFLEGHGWPVDTKLRHLHCYRCTRDYSLAVWRPTS